MKFFNSFFFIFFLFLIDLNAQSLEINDSRWRTEWTDSLLEVLSKDSYAFLENKVVEEDLNKLYCPKYNELPNEEKAKFWVLFFSGLTKAESNFNEKIRSKTPKGRPGNYGLLQLSKATARSHCKLKDEDVFDPIKNLTCGVSLMNYQLKGAPNKNGKVTKKRTLNRIFTSPMFLWGPLRSQDYRGKAVVTSWMKSHTKQINCQL